MSSRGLSPIGRSDNEFKGTVYESLPAQTKQCSVLEVESESKNKQNKTKPKTKQPKTNKQKKTPNHCIRGGASVPDVQEGLGLGRIRRI